MFQCNTGKFFIWAIIIATMLVQYQSNILVCRPMKLYCRILQMLMLMCVFVCVFVNILDIIISIYIHTHWFNVNNNVFYLLWVVLSEQYLLWVVLSEHYSLWVVLSEHYSKWVVLSEQLLKCPFCNKQRGNGKSVEMHYLTNEKMLVRCLVLTVIEKWNATTHLVLHIYVQTLFYFMKNSLHLVHTNITLSLIACETRHFKSELIQKSALICT